MDQNVTKDRPKAVMARFQLAAARLADAWAASGIVVVSADDMALAAEYLEHVGWQVRQAQGLIIHLTDRDGRTEEVSREQAVLCALRELASAR
jgi:hypothetical protein